MRCRLCRAVVGVVTGIPAGLLVYMLIRVFWHAVKLEGSELPAVAAEVRLHVRLLYVCAPIALVTSIAYAMITMLSQRVPEGRRMLWVCLLVVASPFSQVVFWYLHIWRSEEA